MRIVRILEKNVINKKEVSTDFVVNNNGKLFRKIGHEGDFSVFPCDREGNITGNEIEDWNLKKQYIKI